MKNLLSCLTVLLVVNTAFAQTPQTETTPRKWGVEVNALSPIFPGGILNAKATRTLWAKNSLRGEVLVGFNTHVPEDRDTEGRFTDYTLATGYRQYFGKHFNVEYYQLTGLGRLRNHVSTGRDYNSFDWLVAGLVGYRADLGKRFYVLPQVGVASVVYKSDPWPVFEDNTLKKEVGETPFFYGGVQVGIAF